MEPNDANDLRARVARLEQELVTMRSRLDTLEQRSGATARPAPAPTPRATPAVTPPRPPMPPPVPVAARREVFQPAPTVPSPIQEALTKAWRTYGPPPGMSWEMALGTWWLPRIGVGVFCVAVVWLLGLAMGQIPSEVLPYVRLGLAATGCAILLGVGRWLEPRHAGYARVLLAGGIALSYLVVFATHYIPFTQITNSPVPALLGLTALAVAWFGVAAQRHSWLLAMFVTFAAHGTIALASTTLASPPASAILGLLALAGGTAAFLMRLGWRSVAFLGMAGAYGNYFLWLSASTGEDTIAAFTMTTSVLAALFAIFLAADFFQPVAQRTRLRPRSVYASVNTAALIALGYALVQGFSVADEYTPLFFFAVAATLAGVAAAYAYLRDGDRTYDLYLAKASLVTAFGLMELFDGRTLAAALALEGLVLLVLSVRQGLASTRLFALLAAAAGLAYGVALGFPAWDPELGLQPNLALPVVAAVLAFWAMAALYTKGDWQRHAGPPVDTLAWWQPVAVALEWIRDADGAVPRAREHIAAALAVAGAFLLYIHAQALVPPPWHLAVLAPVGVVLVLGAAASRVAAWTYGAFLLALFAGAGVVLGAVRDTAPAPLWVAIGGIFALGIASERRYFGREEGLAPLHRHGVGPRIYGAVVLLSLIALAAHRATPIPAEVWAAAFAAISIALSFVLRRRTWQILTAVYLAAGALAWAQTTQAALADERAGSIWWMALAGMVIVAAGLLADRLFARHEGCRIAMVSAGVGLAAAGLVAFIAPHFMFGTAWQTAPQVLIALAFLGWGGAFRNATALGVGLLGGSAATALLVRESAAGTLDSAPMLLGFAAVIALWVLVAKALTLPQAKPLAGDDTPGLEQAEGALAFVAAGLLTAMLHLLPAIPGNYTSIAWTLAAFALFGASFGLRQHHYRYAGLALIFLVLGRVFLVDTAQLEPAYRIAAGAVLGAAMCAIGYGYVRARAAGKEDDE